MRSVPQTQSAALWPVDAMPRFPLPVPEQDQLVQLVAALQALLSASSLSEAAEALLREGGACIGAEHGRVLVAHDGHPTDLEVIATSGMPAELSGRRVGPELHTPAHDAARLRSMTSSDVASEWKQQYATYSAALESAGLNGFAAIPLECESRLVGVLELALPVARPLLNGERALIHSVVRNGAVVLDRLRRLEAERDARLHAERANQVKADFLAVVSHELRTPLNAIGGYTELLQMGLRGPLTPSQEEDLRRIEHSQRHLLSLVNAILNFAKLEAGRVNFVLGEVSAAEVLEDIEPLVQPQARAKGVRLRRDACDAALIVMADREKLQQVLLNLLTNAIKYTASGGTVTLRCAPARRHATFQVIDTGIGIPAAKIDRVFEPFVQVTRSLSTPNDGVGLGLAISRELARGMRGTLTVSSVEGEGSTFTLTIPRAER